MIQRIGKPIIQGYGLTETSPVTHANPIDAAVLESIGPVVPGTEDKIYEEQGVKILVDKKSYIVLNGTTLDYTDGLQGTGFVFQNPNAKSTCGCGSSFSV